MSMASDEALDLLQEWMEWWEVDDRASAKLPNSLHVRTAITLQVERGWLPIDLRQNHE